MTLKNQNQRFDALDGLRGLAALVVMLCHYSQFFGMNWFKNAATAVDLFFVLSGFVIAHSYGNRIINGMQFHKFFMMRLLRLGPLNLLAIMIGCLTFITMDYIVYRNYQISDLILAKAVAFGATFIPYLNPYSWPYGNYGEIGGVFPLNLPAWSLFYEMLAYIIFFGYIFFIRKLPGLVFCCLSFFFFLSVIIYYGDTNPGWSESNLYQGIIRVIGDFFIGTLIYQFPLNENKLNKTICLLCFIIAFSLFFTGNNYAVIFNIFIVIPLLIWSMGSISVSGPIKSICKFLGFISFPIYILHIPVITVILHQRKLINYFFENIRFPVLILFILFASIIFAYLDLKIRSYFYQKINKLSLF